MMIMTSSNKDIHTTKESFLVAAASYFGLPDDQVMQGSTVEVSADGTLDVVLRVSLTPDDLTGIAGRMKAMAEEQARQPGPVQPHVEVPPTREQLRDWYNNLDRKTRSGYGSFHNYCLVWGAGDPYNSPAMVDKIELPAHVYLSPAEATPQQKAMAIGQDEKGNYAVAVEDLTKEQARQFAGATTRAANAVLQGNETADQLRQAYVERTMAARERLNGADGKPTSNADDLGGVPG